MKRRPAALSIRPDEYAQAKARADSLGLNFSAYVNSLIRADMQRGGGLAIVLREEPPPPLLERKPVEYEP